MALVMRCDHCGERIRLNDAHRSVRCPHCGEPVLVRGRGRRQRPNSLALWVGLGVGGVGLVLAAVVVVAAVAVVGRRVPAGPNAAPAPAVAPALTAAQPIQPGVLFQEATLQPGKVPMKVWYYRPEQVAGRVPLVLVPPAGSTLLAGMDLGDGDRAEHFPYVRAGFAVGAFEIDGAVPAAQRNSDAAVLKAAREFRDARAGLTNAAAALDYLLAKAPDVDPARVFIAGHSSAATLALLVAEHDPRVKGCVAYCGVSDVEERVAQAIPLFDRAIPGYRDFLRFSSPKTHAAKLTCPVLLFHAQDDTVVPVSQSTAFAARLKATNNDVTVAATARGGHYKAMIDAGIPAGIAWMRAR